MVDYYELSDDENIPYRCEVELDLIDEAPQEERPWLLWMFVKAQSPVEQPFSDFLDDLKGSLNESIDAVYAGSIAKEGWVELYFYAPSSKRFENITTEAMNRHGGFAYERGSSRDGKWEMYLERLYPDAYALLNMQNRHTIEALVEAGDDLNKIREVEHYLFFQTRSAMERAVAFLTAHGMSLKEFVTHEDEEYAYGAVLTKSDSVTPEAVEETTSLCFDAALNDHGHYEGWSTVLG